MPVFEKGDLTTGVTAANAAFEFRAGAQTCFVYELGLFLNAATASILGLGRPANNGSVAGGTVGVGQNIDEDGAAALAGIVLSGWTTAPTAPTNFMRQIGLPAAIGNGIVWSWPRGLRVKAARSLVVWNIATSSALRYYVAWEE